MAKTNKRKPSFDAPEAGSTQGGTTMFNRSDGAAPALENPGAAKGKPRSGARPAKAKPTVKVALASDQINTAAASTDGVSDRE